jgi:hypothetical protein
MTGTRDVVEPIVHTYRLPCSPADAFRTYVERIGEWWHPDYTIAPGSFSGIVIDPRVGGLIRTIFLDGPDDVWGTVTEWDAPNELAHTFTLAQRADAPSEVRVRFRRDGDGCAMTFVHGGWNAANAEYREKFSDWPIILDRLAALTRDGRPPPPG